MHYHSYPTNELKVVKNHYRFLENSGQKDVLHSVRIAPFRSLRNWFSK